MRLDDYSASNWMLRNLSNQRSDLQKLQRQAAGGKRLEARSDAPADAANLARLRQDSAATDRWKANLGTAVLWTRNTEPQLTRLMEDMQRTQELAVQGGDATLTPIDRRNLATQVDALLEDVVGVANTRQGDLYLFGGTDSTAQVAMVTRDAGGRIASVAVTAGARRSVQFDAAQNMSYGAHASDADDGLFVRPDAANPGTDKVNLFANLISLRDRLLAGQVPAATDLTAIRDSLENVACRMMENGVEQSRLNALDQHLLRVQDTQSTERLPLEEADLAQVLTQLSRAEAALTATMQIAGRVGRMNLMDYL